MRVRRQALLDAISATEARLSGRDQQRWEDEMHAYQQSLTEWHDAGRKKFQDAMRKLANQKTPVTSSQVSEVKELAWKGWTLDDADGYRYPKYSTKLPKPVNEVALPMDLTNLRVLLEASDDEQIETSQLERQGYRNMAALLAEGSRK